MVNETNVSNEVRDIADIDIKRALFWTLCELDNLIAQDVKDYSLTLLRNTIEYQLDESKDMGDLPVEMLNELVATFDSRIGRGITETSE
tara:strand:+ start:199 stop:465 length:267 start_codon:yes stop_codon:yes gene_type:complete